MNQPESTKSAELDSSWEHKYPNGRLALGAKLIPLSSIYSRSKNEIKLISMKIEKKKHQCLPTVFCSVRLDSKRNEKSNDLRTEVTVFSAVTMQYSDNVQTSDCRTRN